MFSHMLALALLLAAAPPKELATKFGCSDAQPCEVVSETKAGTDASGVKLRVLQVTRGQRDECTVEEYWVVRVSKPLEAKLLLSLCNDGYGAAGVGEDTVTVKPNRRSATASWAIFGGKGTAEDAALKVVAHDKDNLLFLEITDDAWTANERKWIAGDHLEVWLASDVPSTLQDCLGKRGAEAAQWAIDVPSGATRPGHGGRLGLPRAEVVTDGKVVRMKLALAQGDWPAITLVYSDSDDGQKQERLLATSQFAFPQAATLGQLHPLAARAATCEVKEGALTGVVKTKPPAKGALFPSSGD